MTELLAGRYRLLRQIGVGGMASVHEAEDTALSRRVAIKMLRSELARDEAFVARFSREARAGARLKHPNIVDVYDVVQNGDTNLIVMELIQGLSVRDRLRHGPITPNECIRIGVQIAEALDYAHSQGIVHRDVKPHNILITENGSAKLVDFGIAVARGLATITDDGTILGTVHYVAPEQVRGEPATPQSDLYSLGAVLYEMATGRTPFAGDSAIEIATKHVNATPIPPSQLNPTISPALERAILQALNKSPEQRPASGAELARSLSAAMDLDDQPTQVVSRPSTNATSAESPEPRGPSLEASPPASSVWPLVLLGILALSLVAGLIPLWATVLRSGVL